MPLAALPLLAVPLVLVASARLAGGILLDALNNVDKFVVPDKLQ